MAFTTESNPIFYRVTRGEGFVRLGISGFSTPEQIINNLGILNIGEAATKSLASVVDRSDNAITALLEDGGIISTGGSIIPYGEDILRNFEPLQEWFEYFPLYYIPKRWNPEFRYVSDSKVCIRPKFHALITVSDYNRSRVGLKRRCLPQVLNSNRETNQRNLFKILINQSFRNLILNTCFEEGVEPFIDPILITRSVLWQAHLFNITHGFDRVDYSQKTA